MDGTSFSDGAGLKRTCVGVRCTGAWRGGEGPMALGVRHLWCWLAAGGAEDCSEEVLYILPLQLCRQRA